MTDENQQPTTEQHQDEIIIGQSPVFADFDKQFLADRGISADSKMTTEQLVALMKEFNELRNKQGESFSDGQQNEVNLDDEKSPKQPIEVDQNEDWVSTHDRILSDFARARGKEWERITQDENGNDIVGLKGRIGDAEIHFTSPTKATANIAGIDMLVHMASKNGQDIKFNDKWTDEFKAKMIEACEKQGVTLTGRPEEQTTQSKQQEQETTPPTKSEPKYKVVPRFNNNRLDQFAREMTGNGSIELAEKSIKAKEQEIKEGKYDYSESVKDKTTAELLMRKYVLAEKTNDSDMMQACETSLQRYGVEKIEKNKLGQYQIIAGKTYDERSPEEKSKIDKAFKKALPVLSQQESGNSNQESHIAQAVKNNSRQNQ